jgi:hypothetical protein
MTKEYKIGKIEGDLPTNEKMRDHKFVVMARDLDNDNLEFTLHSIDDDSVLHQHIVKGIPEPKGTCVGGGRIKYSDYHQGTVLGEESTDYGPVHTEVRDIFGDMLSQTYGITYAGHGIDFGKEEINTEWEERNRIQISHQ